MPSGLNAYVEIFTEATYGTTPGSGGITNRIVSESWDRQADQTQGNRGLGRVMKSGIKNRLYRSGGDVTFDCTYGGLERWLLHFLGANTTQANTPVTGAHTHTLTPSLTRQIGASLKFGRDTDKAVYPGSKFTSLNFSMSQEILQMVVGGVGRVGSTSAAAAGTGYTTTPDVIALQGTNGLTAEVGGTPVEFSSAEVNMSWPHTENREYVNDEHMREPVISDFLSVSGVLRREFDDTDWIADFLAGTEQVLEFKFKSDAFITGTTPYEWKIKLFNAIFTRSSEAVRNAGPVPDEVNFTAMVDGSGNSVSVVLVNGTATVT